MPITSVIKPKDLHHFSIEMRTQKIDKRLLIEQSEHGLRIFIQQGGNLDLVEKHMINGLPQTSLIPKVFFDSCYAKIVDLYSGGSKLYFSQRLKGGGTGASTNRTGAYVTRTTQEASSFFTGERTEQEVKGELQNILGGIHNNCTRFIQRIHQMPAPPESNFVEWNELDNQLDIYYSNNNIDKILENIENRIIIIENRKKAFSSYLIGLNGILAEISSSLKQIEIDSQEAIAKQREIERIKQARSAFAATVDFLTVAIDGVILDPILGARERTTVWYFLQGYDCMGRPPVSLEEVDSWMRSAQKLNDDLCNKRVNLELSIFEFDNRLIDLHQARVDMSGKKIDILMAEKPNLKAILNSCKFLSWKY